MEMVRVRMTVSGGWWSWELGGGHLKSFRALSLVILYVRKIIVSAYPLNTERYNEELLI